MIHNLDVIDSLKNGQLETFVEAIMNKDGKVHKLVLKLDKPNTEKFNRDQNQVFAKKFPDHVFVERVSWQYSRWKKGGLETSKATVIQFPIRLAFGITAHKVQGSSIPYPTKVALDIDSTFTAGQTYVMLSRVQCLDQIFIVGRLQESKIRVSKKALNELQRLERISINRNPRIWMKDQGNVLKIATLNCAGLEAHIEDIKVDQKLLMADIILLQETSLEIGSTNQLEISSHPNILHVRQGRGKGVTIYMKEKFGDKIIVCGQGYTMAAVNCKGLKIFNVYRSSNGSKEEICEKFDKLIDDPITTIVCGDFNVCGQREEKNKITRHLLSYGLPQLVKEPTHVRGRQIDHIYLREGTQMKVLDIERLSPYYTDHDALLLTLEVRKIFTILQFFCHSI